MSDERKLVPVEQHTIEFHDDELQAVRMANGEIYVAIKPICEYIGVNWAGQLRNLKNDPILSSKIMSIDILSTDIDTNNTRPHTSEMVGLRLEFVNAAKETREAMERQIGTSIITGDNFLPNPKQPKLLGDDPADE